MPAIIDISLLSVGITFAYSLISKLLVNQKEIRFLKNQMNEHKKRLEEAKKENNTEKINDIFSEIMKTNQKLMRKNMKPMLMSLILVFVIFSWIPAVYGEEAIFMPFNIPLIGNSLHPFWWYVFISIPSAMFFRKIIGLE